MSVLIVAPTAPWPPTHGAAVRNSAFISALSQEYDVEVLALTGSGNLALEHPDARTSRHIRLRQRSRLCRVMNAAIGRSPHLVHRHGSHELRTAVQQRLAVGGVETVQVEGLQLAHIVRDVATSTEGNVRRPRVVYDAHNVEWRLQSSLANRAQGIRAWYSWRQAALLHSVERWVVRNADAVLASSEADAVSLETLGGRSVTAICHPVVAPLKPADRESEAKAPRVLLAANFAYRPNVLGAEWLFGSVWSEVLRQIPEAELRVVGPSSLDLRAIAPARCTVGGLVEDVVAEHRAAWVVASPAPVGSGAPLKVLESLAQGRPVVARTQGFVGLPHSVGGVATADTSHAFANKVVELLQHTRNRRAMGRAGHKYVTEHHDPSALSAELLKVHDGLGACARNGAES